MKRSLIALAVAAAAVTPFAAQAQDSGDWIVRARALNLVSDNGGSTNPNLDLSVNDKWFPEVDISYFFTPNIALELILTYPQKHDIESAGAKIGSFKHLPPTLTAQYHFTGMGFRPYVGLGINYTHISDVEWDASVAPLDPSVKKDSFGLAAQIGADVPLGGGWLFNVDVKKVQIGTDVSLGGTKIGDLKVDPWLLSIGVGKRF
ncbi:OmpW family protein [Ideonella sp.]|uniref:OmpW/AlkL family protein n=1 Tax=Ideonella sp. TaxID=1929293 RepID=UPI0035B15826